ncbi:MAG TPA: 50S ribosomal protein L21 [Solirubrobacterales bacterium]|nr:50S ribosomal protein L21 [Solirubrobacterales bacterium]
MNTYAVIESGGKQYKVEKGTSLLVDRLSAKQGDKVALRPVMFRDKEVVAGAKELEKVKVEATVTEHLRGEKIKVFKYKPKKGYRRRAGHRSELTKLEVTEVSLGGRKAAAPKKEEPAEKKEAAAKPAEAKKPAEKKPAAAKKSAAKKETAKKPAAKKAPAKKAAAKASSTKKPAAKAKAKAKKAKPAAKKDSDDGS